MRLYLSSHGLGDHKTRLVELARGNRTMLFIDNAKDYLPESERSVHVVEKLQEYGNAGFSVEELDLREYFGRANELENFIAKKSAGIIWLSGGNTFILRRALDYSGLDNILKNSLKADQFVYGGSSAGSILATKTLHGTEMGDDPYVVPDGYQPEIIWDGLGLIYQQLVPHYESDWFYDQAQAMADFFDHNGFKYETLRDGEVLLVESGSETKLTV